MQTLTLTRRRFSIAAGTTAILGAAGIAIGSEEAGAAISSEFSIADATFTPSDNELAELWLTASGNWEFSDLSSEAAEWRVYLLVDDQSNGGNWESVGMASGSTSGSEASGTYALRGEVTGANHYTPVDVSDGTPVELTIPASVLLMVLDSNGDTLASAEAMDTVTVTVKPGGAVSGVDGSGTMHGVDDSDGPTPTVAGQG